MLKLKATCLALENMFLPVCTVNDNFFSSLHEKDVEVNSKNICTSKRSLGNNDTGGKNRGKKVT